MAVQLPEGEDTNEWLAVHSECYVIGENQMDFKQRPPAVDFFNHLNMLYGTVTEFCTPQEVRDFHIASSFAHTVYMVSVRLCPLALGECMRPLPVQGVVRLLLISLRPVTNTSGRTA